MTVPAPDVLADVHVVLVRPRWARNLGAVARAMKNFRLRRLTLVDSRIGSWADAHQMAVHADDVLAGARATDTLPEALAGARWVVGTGNRAPAGMRVLTPREVALEMRRQGPPTLVFGGEIHGLENAELLRCHAVSTVPTDDEQSSLNLAQAVAVCGAELFAANASDGAHDDGSEPPAPPVEAPASAELFHHVERLLGELLHGSRWATKSRPKDAIARLMQPLYRAGMTEAEARAWLVALGKAAQPLPAARHGGRARDSR